MCPPKVGPDFAVASLDDGVNTTDSAVYLGGIPLSMRSMELRSPSIPGRTSPFGGRNRIDGGLKATPDPWVVLVNRGCP